MNKIEKLKNEIIHNSKGSLEFLEYAMNTVESNDNFNYGQNKEISKMYNDISKIWKELNYFIENN